MGIRFRLVVEFLSFLAAGKAAADPTVSMGEGQTFSWSEALAGDAGGTLQPVGTLTDHELPSTLAKSAQETSAQLG